MEVLMETLEGLTCLIRDCSLIKDHEMKGAG